MRIDGKVVAQVSANILASDVQKASQNLQDNIDKLDLPDGVEVEIRVVQPNKSMILLPNWVLAMLAAIADCILCTGRYIWRRTGAIRHPVLPAVHRYWYYGRPVPGWRYH